MGLPYHQAAIRPTELPRRERGSGLFAQSSGARSFLRYGYGDLLTEDRRYGVIHRIWPGTQRLLLWGDPAFAAAYGRAIELLRQSGLRNLRAAVVQGPQGIRPARRTRRLCRRIAAPGRRRFREVPLHVPALGPAALQPRCRAADLAAAASPGLWTRRGRGGNGAGPREPHPAFVHHGAYCRRPPTTTTGPRCT